MLLFYIKLSMDYVTSILITLIFILMLIIIHLGNTMIYLLRKNMQEQIHSNKFFHRIVDSWNLLPYDTRKAINVNIFKRGVKKFLSDSTLKLVFLCWITDFISLLHYYIFIGDLFIMGSWTPLRIIHMAIYIIISLYYPWCH